MIFNNKLKDHRIIAKQLCLYQTIMEAPGMICWLKNGWIIMNELKKILRKKLLMYNYQEVNTPILMNILLWQQSKHLTYYNEYIYQIINNNHHLALKPMNCPGHIKIFSYKIRSYKNLPLRIAEFGSCFRNEATGALHGLMRLKQFTQDDAHIFCTIDQIKLEIYNCIKLIYDIYKLFNFLQIKVELATRPIKKDGDDLLWDCTEKYLIDILKCNNIKYHLKPNEGAFYGPKIEFSIYDNFNRYWQCGTIQLDFLLAKKFNIFYIDKNNKRIYPIIIHRAILGSLERFIGILLENTKGNLPIWIAPIQIMIINITNNEIAYVNQIEQILKLNDLRIKKNITDNKINYKIKSYIMHKIPYLIICGPKEKESNTITIRTRNGKNIKDVLLNNFLEKINNDIKLYQHILIGD